MKTKKLDRKRRDWGINMLDNVWLQRAEQNLLPLSENRNKFYLAQKEWTYVGLFDNENADFNCQLCGHKEIRYEYTIQNNINGNEMITGSSCINKFINHMAVNKDYLYDVEGIVVTEKRLKDDKHVYWEQILYEALNACFSSNDFQRSIISKIKEEGKLTINQVKCLRRFYDALTENKQTAFRNIISIRLARGNQKKYKELTDSEKEFILKLLSSEQKVRMSQ